ncbi:unnamed protein product [Umbelopsis vinacea]
MGKLGKERKPRRLLQTKEDQVLAEHEGDKGALEYGGLVAAEDMNTTIRCLNTLKDRPDLVRSKEFKQLRAVMHLVHESAFAVTGKGIEPGTFRLWLRILERVPNSIIWLLTFPPADEENLLRTAMEWCGPQVAQRVVFTNVAPKHIHIHRGRVADLFLDTPECNAHTTAADILWSGTPILTWPNEKEYEERAVALANGLKYNYVSVNGELQRIGKGSLHDLRKRLFNTREHSRLFDTLRWTRNLETGYIEAWKRWVTGEEFEDTNGNLDQSGCIWITDSDDTNIHRH